MKIIFRKFTNSNYPLLEPSPSVRNLPEWYKKMSPFTKGKKEKFWPNGTKNLTVKRCNPLGDALSAGYFLVLENSLFIEKNDDGSSNFVWNRGGDNFISTHGKSQINNDLIPVGFDEQPYKFANDWSIQTPKGYSVLVTHPLNRNAEPFLTLSGIVDTDTYQNSIQLPFLLRKDFEGMIEAGTPIAQVIPFKRESWKSEFPKHDPKFFQQASSEFGRTLHRYYKRFHWKRKEWK